MIRSTLDLSSVPVAHLQAILRHPNVAEGYKDHVARELRNRPNQVSSKRGQGPRQQVTVTQPEPGSLFVILRPEPPSANELLRWLKRQPYKYGFYRDFLAREFAVWRRLLGAGLKGTVQVEHRWRTMQARDEDGLGTSLKPVLDALQLASLIENDDGPLVFGGQTAGGEGSSVERGITLIVRQVA